MAVAMHLEALRKTQLLDQQRLKFISNESEFSKHDSTKSAEPLKAPRRAKTFSTNPTRNAQDVWWPFRAERPYTGCLKKRLSETDYFAQW